MSEFNRVIFVLSLALGACAVNAGSPPSEQELEELDEPAVSQEKSALDTLNSKAKEKANEAIVKLTVKDMLGVSKEVVTTAATLLKMAKANADIYAAANELNAATTAQQEADATLKMVKVALGFGIGVVGTGVAIALTPATATVLTGIAISVTVGAVAATAADAIAVAITPAPAPAPAINAPPSMP